ncbi:uncharacterized protein AMSG_01291 [Thecamonas trahens ATCC 50062]|uniref:DUF962 domain-containing protein n=1 Tax=Thecamonas trahens ATCC 50062 TaxID=461836 RepID=A0A0L0DNL2_THETB|nr:hypothetical protein AMSG_01291 [Thecamonas trahens ATCC 50062]KNC53581.1 hypothetical protein AMSG_01291 [Thecamonas trahens ATCC 50062]|eukprot:XP_013761898.1 hypothetical protein AMSG_01291 [Thecamonas trahens ATCC 50062]
MSYLEKNFAFYASYHSDTINVAVHIICVWPLLWTGQAMLALLALPGPVAEAVDSALPPAVAPYAGANWALVGTLVYVLYYIVLDHKAGFLAAALVVAGNAAANHLVATYPGELVLKAAAGIHIGCWVAQIAAHKIFEGRAPALLDNLAQAFLMAPYFVMLEIIMHLGYEPSPGFIKRATARAAEARAEFEASQKTKAS